MRQLVDRAGQFRIDANKHNMRLARERNEFQRRSLMSGRSQPQRDSLIQAYAKEESSLRSSIKAVDDMEQIGGLVMRSMQKQNEHIKNAQTRLVTVFSYLGLSNNLIRTITRREHVDRIIFWVGVVVTLIVLGLLYIYYIR
jgi:Golgi SNAP receptor complex protein 2